MSNCVLFANSDDSADPLLGMANVDAPKEKGKLSWCLQLNFFLEDETGMPTPDEHAALSEYQDELERRISGVTKLVYAAHYSGSGFRDAFFYLAEPERAAAMLSEIVGTETPHEFQYELTYDPDWEHVEKVFGQLSPAKSKGPSTSIYPWFLERLRGWFR